MTNGFGAFYIPPKDSAIRLRTAILCTVIVAACIERGSKRSVYDSSSADVMPADASERIIATTLGDDHACALSSYGSAFCWGRHDSWILGADDTSASVVRVAGDRRFSDIAAGSSFTCAVDVEGLAFCWGGGQRGELGGGSYFDVAVEPQPVAGDHRFTTITAGSRHACAIDVAGAAWCWGDNSYGQLGDGSVKYASSPIRVSGGHIFMQLAAGAESNTTCGVTTDGAGFCWGERQAFNNRGPFTRGDSAAERMELVSAGPEKVPTLSRLRVIDPGTDAACALDSRGYVYCWGSNALGQLGLGYPARDTLIPTPSQRVASDEQFVSLSVGDGRACAVSRKSATYCWGSAAGQMLGVKPDDSCGTRLIACARSPALVRDASLTQIALGPHDRICGAGRYSTAPAYCWGRDFKNSSLQVPQPRVVALWQSELAGTQGGR